MSWFFRSTGADNIARIQKRFDGGFDRVGGTSPVCGREPEVCPVPRPAAMMTSLPENSDPILRVQLNGITTRSELSFVAKELEKLRLHDGC